MDDFLPIVKFGILYFKDITSNQGVKIGYRGQYIAKMSDIDGYRYDFANQKLIDQKIGQK